MVPGVGGTQECYKIIKQNVGKKYQKVNKGERNFRGVMWKG